MEKRNTLRKNTLQRFTNFIMYRKYGLGVPLYVVIMLAISLPFFFHQPLKGFIINFTTGIYERLKTALVKIHALENILDVEGVLDSIIPPLIPFIPLAIGGLCLWATIKVLVDGYNTEVKEVRGWIYEEYQHSELIRTLIRDSRILALLFGKIWDKRGKPEHKFARLLTCFGQQAPRFFDFDEKYPVSDIEDMLLNQQKKKLKRWIKHSSPSIIITGFLDVTGFHEDIMKNTNPEPHIATDIDKAVTETQDLCIDTAKQYKVLQSLRNKSSNQQRWRTHDTQQYLNQIGAIDRIAMNLDDLRIQQRRWELSQNPIDHKAIERNLSSIIEALDEVMELSAVNPVPTQISNPTPTPNLASDSTH